MDLKELDKLSSEELAAKRAELLEQLTAVDPTALAENILDTADFLVKRREQWEAEEAEKKRVKLAAISNMSFAELKENNADLVAAAAMEPVADVAARFVQSLTDAKQRDERMAEMGAEITTLKATIAEREAEIEQLKAPVEG